ncbi:MAG: fumarate reductase [Candidatus Tectimicrobiota bacterium]|nr:MAG: fumarate reductase [Candidatus Tectomicrobia bacterium]
MPGRETMTLPAYETLTTDILILGSGGAGLLAALHAHDAQPRASIHILVKGLLGKSGCTRMVQGGYNAVLHPQDSLELHFRDTLAGGAYLNDQELAWTLVAQAPERIRELESRFGCFFDRNPDGTLHQKPFAGQSFDRTVHRGDLTGIEIMNRLAEQVLRHGLPTLEDHRALALLPSADGGGVAGALCLDVRRGTFLVIRAKATLLATGGGPTMYKITAASAEKTVDGLAMAFRAGARLVDMEMVQFHPTGLLVGESGMSGTVLEEGLRGAGGHLLNGRGERFMAKYDPQRLERSTRDIVARSAYLEIMAGRGTPHGGVYLDVSHLGAAFVEQHFPGMVARCRDMGFDLAREPVEVSPTAHYLMGGVKIDTACRSNLEGLFVAGEDAGGVHGANRLGGNGVACSTVFGGIAGDSMAAYLAGRALPPLDEAQVRAALAWAVAPFAAAGEEDVYALRDELKALMWEKAGLVRHASDLKAAQEALAHLRWRAARVRVHGTPRLNLEWQEWLNLDSLLTVSDLIVASALERQESRGSHYRSDYPHPDDGQLYNVYVQREGEAWRLWRQPVVFSRLKPPATGTPERAYLAQEGE